MLQLKIIFKILFLILKPLKGKKNVYPERKKQDFYSQTETTLCYINLY